MLFFNIFHRRFLANCGHFTFKKDEVISFDEIRIMDLLIVNNQTRYCHKCLSEMSLKCPACKRVIFVNDPIVANDSNKIIACAKCSEFNVADCNGVWMTPGVFKNASPIELGAMYFKSRRLS